MLTFQRHVHYVHTFVYINFLISLLSTEAEEIVGFITDNVSVDNKRLEINFSVALGPDKQKSNPFFSHLSHIIYIAQYSTGTDLSEAYVRLQPFRNIACRKIAWCNSKKAGRR